MCTHAALHEALAGVRPQWPPKVRKAVRSEPPAKRSAQSPTRAKIGATGADNADDAVARLRAQYLNPTQLLDIDRQMPDRKTTCRLGSVLHAPVGTTPDMSGPNSQRYIRCAPMVRGRRPKLMERPLLPAPSRSAGGMDDRSMLVQIRSLHGDICLDLGAIASPGFGRLPATS